MSTLAAFTFILVMMLFGRLLAWKDVLLADAPATLNRVVLYVCLPAAILLHAPPLTFQPGLASFILVPWLTLLLGAGLVLGLAKAMRFGKSETAVVMMLAVLGNTSFLGLAVISSLASEDALPYAVLYDQLGSFLQLSTYGVLVLAICGNSEKPSAAAIGRRIIMFPPFLALLLAITLLPDTYPAVVEGALRRLESALLPLVALAIGIQLRFKIPREYYPPLAVGLLVKLLIMPALALGLCITFGFADEVLAAAVLEAAMPAMITASALLSAANLAPELSAAMVGWGTILSMATLPFWKWLLVAVAHG